MHSIRGAMRALVKDGVGFGLCQVPAPGPPGPEDVIVRLTHAGICRTDLYAAEGRLPTVARVVLGHEGAGIVEAAGERANVREGDRVTIVPYVACGTCQACIRRVDPLACEASRRVGIDCDGVFAEYVRLPAASVRVVPPALPLRLAAYVEPVAAALAVLRARPRAGARIVIYGKNRIAELTRRILAVGGDAEVVVVSAEEALALDLSSFDLAVETAATGDALRALIRAVRRGGTIVLKSRPFEPIPLDVTAAVDKEVSLQAVRYASFEDAIARLASGSLVVDDLLGETFPLESFDDAFAAARRESTKPFFTTSGQ